MKKNCTACKQSKDYEEYGTCSIKRNKTGRESQCKACRKLYRDRPENLARNQAYQAEAYNENKEERLEADRIAYAFNPEVKKARAKEYVKNNREKVRASKNAYKKKRRKTDLNYRIKENLRCRLWHALNGKVKAGSSVSDLGCSVDELRAHLESLFTPGMSWANYGHLKGKWEIDHIKPLQSFTNLSDREQLLEACHYTNLQPLWWEDNNAKHNHSDYNVSKSTRQV